MSVSLSAERLRRHAGLVILQLLFSVLALSLIRRLPYSTQPDEATHYHFNVEFILQQHRLPVSGIDDLQAYHTLLRKKAGRCTTLCSYVVYPPVSYIVAAGVAWIVTGLTGAPGYIGARLASFGWGLAFLTFLYTTAWAVTRRRTAALLTAFSFAFLPSVLFVSTYVNSDIFSLALGAGVAYAFVRWLQQPEACKAWLTAAAFGLFCSAKYNFALDGLALGVGLMLARRWLGLSFRTIRSLVWRMAVCALLLSGPWYLRNAILYHDPLGQGFMLATMARHNPPVFVFPFSLFSWVYLAYWHWFGLVLDTFFSPTLSHAQVPWLRTAVGLLALSLSLTILLDKDNRNKTLLLLNALFLLANLLLMGWNSMKNDFQAQGRYLFPILPPLAVYLAWLCRRNPRYAGFLGAFGSLVAVLVLVSLMQLLHTPA